MSPRSNNQKQVNTKLMELNKKYIPDNKVILNTAPPRAGKTINTILYHVENDIPVIVFVDNKEQAEDIIEDLGEIDDYFKAPYYWKSKKELCYILANKEKITKEKGRKFYKFTQFKYKNGLNICEKCKYHDNCEWAIQKISLLGNNLIIMNKKNIETATVDNPNEIDHLRIFHKHYMDKDDETPRNIVYDEKLEQLHKIKFKLTTKDAKLLTKIIKIKEPETDITIFDGQDFINEIDVIKNIFKKDLLNHIFMKKLNFDFTIFGEFDEKIYFKIFLNKIKNNIKIYDYLKTKNAPLPTKGNQYDLKQFTYEKLYIDILFERMNEHKIILLDATPLQPIVEKIEKMDNYKRITLDDDIFDKNSFLLHIYRSAKHMMTSRKTIRDRTPNIEQDIFQDKSYNTLLKTHKNIRKYKPEINFGIITYKIFKNKKDTEKEPIKPYIEIEKKLKDVSTLYFGNVRGRAELNDSEILQIIGTDRHKIPSMYYLYRYLGGEKSWKELKQIKGRVERLTYNDELFNQIINHQIDSEMEQAIFRNMPHMKKRLIILEGHLPEHLKKYFKQCHKVNLKTSNEEIVISEVIKEFLKALNSKTEFNFDYVKKIIKLSTSEKDVLKEIKRIQKKKSRKNIINIAKKINKQMKEENKNKKDKWLIPDTYNYLNENYTNMMKKANIKSFKTFERLYYET